MLSIQCAFGGLPKSQQARSNVVSLAADSTHNHAMRDQCADAPGNSAGLRELQRQLGECLLQVCPTWSGQANPADKEAGIVQVIAQSNRR